MKIQANQLQTYLKRSLVPFYLIFGEEPYQKKEAQDAIRKEAFKQGYTEREVFEISSHFDWEQWFWGLKTPGLFSQKRFIECRLIEGSNIGKKGSEILIQLALDPPTDILFLLSLQKLDAKTENTAWYKALDPLGLSLVVRNLSSKEFSVWLENQLQQAGFKTTKEVIHALTERTEGHLLSAAQSIEKLQLCYPAGALLTLTDITDLIGVDTRFSLFDLVDSILSGSIDRTKRIFACLIKENEPILVLWVLLREVRTIIPMAYDIENDQPISAVLQRHGVWKHRIPLIADFLRRFNVSELQKTLIKAKKIDDIIKGYAPGNAWDALYGLCLYLAGVRFEYT